MAATLAAAAANADAPVCSSTSFTMALDEICQQTCCTCVCQSRRGIYDLAVSQLYTEHACAELLLLLCCFDGRGHQGRDCKGGQEVAQSIL